MSERIEDGTHPNGYAFGHGDHQHGGEPGLTACEYAAIHLRVPNSGTEWLDDMIRESLRDQMAGQALAGMTSNDRLIRTYQSEWFACASYKMADALLAARKGGQS